MRFNFHRLKSIAAFILLFTSLSYSAQDTLFYDADWNHTTHSLANYYRLSTPTKDGLFSVHDYYMDGTLQMKGFVVEYNTDIYQGPVIWYNKKGQKTNESYFQNGIINHESYFTPDGNLLSQGQYEDGQPLDGLFSYDCRICINTFFRYKDGHKVSKVIFYKNTNHIALESQLIAEDENAYYNKMNIAYMDVFYDTNRQLIDTLFYINDPSPTFDHGSYVEFYLDRADVIGVKSIVSYKNKNKNGTHKLFKPNGDLWIEGVYHDNERYDGDFFYGNILKSYTNGIQTGKQISYDEDYNVTASATFVNGNAYDGLIKESNSEYTYRHGVLQEIIDYADTDYAIVARKTTYHGASSSQIQYKKDGTVIATCEYENDLPVNGTVYGYNTLTPYKDGQKHGDETQYEDNDSTKTVIQITKYDQGKVIGKTTYNPMNNEAYYCTFVDEYPSDGKLFDYNNLTVFQDGHRTQEWGYDQDYETKLYSLKEIIHFHPSNYYETIKRTTFHDGQRYELNYQDGMPYAGIVFNYDELITYNDFVKNGMYEYYEKDLLIEKGNYLNNYKDGEILFSPIGDGEFRCIYKEGKPWNGYAIEGNHRNTYLNGKKHGVCFEFNSRYTITQYYENNKKEGKYLCTYDDNKYEGIFKNDLPYSGVFLNTMTYQPEHYKLGKRDGEFVYPNDYLGITTHYIYDNGELILSNIVSTLNDSIIATMRYQGSKPYHGVEFQLQEDYVTRCSLTTYNNGLKHGTDLTYEHLISEGYYWDLVGKTTYALGKKEGGYFLNTNIDSDNNLKLSGTYKNDLPYTGTFIQSNGELQVITNYNDGLKDGVESTYYHDDTYELHYLKGLITNGKHIEVMENAELDDYGNIGRFIHTYKDKKRTKTIVNSVVIQNISYPENGIIFEYEELKVSIEFSNNARSSGNIHYLKSGIEIGQFQFTEGMITKGQLKVEIDHNIFLEQYVKEGSIIAKMYNASFPDLYYKTTSPANLINHTITHKDYIDFNNWSFNTMLPTEMSLYKNDKLLSAYELDGIHILNGITVNITLEILNEFDVYLFKDGNIIKEVRKVSYDEIEKVVLSLN